MFIDFNVKRKRKPKGNDKKKKDKGEKRRKPGNLHSFRGKWRRRNLGKLLRYL